MPELRAEATRVEIPDWCAPAIRRIGGRRPGERLAACARKLGTRIAPQIQLEKSEPWWFHEARHHAATAGRSKQVWTCTCGACRIARRKFSETDLG